MILSKNTLSVIVIPFCNKRDDVKKELKSEPEREFCFKGVFIHYHREGSSSRIMFIIGLCLNKIHNMLNKEHLEDGQLLIFKAICR